MKRHKILVVDDSEMNRELLLDMLKSDFDVFEAADGMEAYSLIHSGEHDFPVMLLDIVMPRMNGFQLLEVMNERGWIKDISVIMISSEKDEPTIERAYNLGVIDFIDRPFNERVIKRRIESSIRLSAKQKEIVDFAVSQLCEKAKDNKLMINILSHIVEFRNGESGLHVVHVSMITKMLLDHLMTKTKKYGISKTDVSLICSASALHDIGKIAINDEILNKPGRFTPEEFAIMKTHSMKGAEMLTELGMWQDEPLVQFAYQICRWHHERWDGSGYPDGISGEQIPIAAQVVAIADAYDALTSKRCYKEAFPHEKAVEMILNGECGAMNPELMTSLSEISDNLQYTLAKSAFTISPEIEEINTLGGYLELQRFDRSKYLVERIHQLQKKNDLVETLTHNVIFELATAPDVINFSKVATERFGLSQSILFSGNSQSENSLFLNDDFEKLVSNAKKTSTENPFHEGKYRLKIHGKECPVSIALRSAWTGEHPPIYRGAVGIIRPAKEESHKEYDSQK